MDALEDRKLLAADISIGDARGLEGGFSLSRVDGALEPGLEADVYRFRGTAGVELTFDMLATSPNFASGTWKLFGPSNQYLASNSLNSDFKAVTPADGVYTLILAGSDLSSRVDYSFRVYQTPPPQVSNFSYAIGAEAGGDVASGDRHVFTFTAGAGQVLYYDALDPDLFSFENLSWTLTDPSGDYVASSSADSDDGPFLTNEAGAYTLTFGGGSQVGDYRFRILDAAAQPALTLGATTTATLDPGVRADLYRFDGTAGDRVRFDLLAADPSFAGDVTVYGPPVFGYLPYVADFSLGADAGFSLPADGTYTIVVGGRSTTPVDYSFRLVEAPPIVVTEFAYAPGQEAQGEVGADERHAYTFTLGAGQVLYYDSLDPDVFSSDGLSWTLTGPGGEVVMSGDADSDDGPFLAGAAGTYTLTFGDDAATGDYRFRLLNVAAQPALTPGAATTSTLDPGVRADVYRFEGTAGQRVRFEALAADPEFAGTITIYGQAVGGFAPYLGSLSLRAGESSTITLPADGTYTVVVGGQSGGPVDYSIRASVLPPPTVTTFAYTPGVTVEGEVPAGDQHAFTFTAAAGRLYYLDALDTDGWWNESLRWRLTGPNGSFVSNGDADYDGGPFVIASAGTYTLTFGGDSQTGDYKFRILDVAAQPALTLGATQAGTLDPGRAADVYRFTGTAGQRMRFDALSADPAYGGSVTIYGPPNFGYAPYVVGFTLGADSTFTLPTSGEYTVVVSGSSSTPVSYSFQLLEAPPVAVTTTALVLDEVTSGQLTQDQRHDFTFEVPAGQTLDVYLDSLDQDYDGARFTLKSPSGIGLTSGSMDGDAFSPIRLTEAGTYTLSIETNSATSDYRFRLMNLASQPLLAATTQFAFQVTLSAASTSPVTVNYATAPGTATSGQDYRAATGTVTFAPGTTTQTVVVEVLDDDLHEADETFFVDLSNAAGATIARGRGTGTILDDDAPPENRAPALAAIPSQSVDERAELVFTASASDPDGDALVYSLVGEAYGATIDASTGQVRFTPAEAGSYTLTVKATDPGGLSDSKAVAITVRDVNRAPSLAPIADQSVDEGTELVFGVAASDPDGDALVYSLVGEAYGATIDASTGQVRFTPAADGVYTLTVQVADPGGLTASRPVLVTAAAVNDPLPTVVGVVVNDGSAQRSRVTSLTVTFSEVVTLGDGAFELRSHSGALVGLEVAASEVGGRSVVVLTFAGDGIEAGSLADGRYTLSILGARVADSGGQALASDFVDEALHRLFGDADGDGDVDNLDLARFARAYQSAQGDDAYLAFLDRDGDGDVDADDRAGVLANRYKSV